MTPFFIVSSGRSGTKMMEKLLGSFPGVEIHHEYRCTEVQPLAVKYTMGISSFENTVKELKTIYKPAASLTTPHHQSRCKAVLWGDSSNKLSWLIKPLADIFPDAKFIHLIRDGRKVVSSFFHKLSDEIYDDESTAVLQKWINSPGQHPEPPYEKKYWWCLPEAGTREAEEFRLYDQFQRICFHWKEVNRVILRDLKHVPRENVFTVKLESLVQDNGIYQSLLDFLGLEDSDNRFSMLQRPHNVNVPEDFLLNADEKEKFWEIAGEMMTILGYDTSDEYTVKY